MPARFSAAMTFVLTLLASADTAAAVQTETNTTDALSLNTAWDLTQKHYPRYKAAISKREAGQLSRAIARAGMLPHISAQFKRTQNWGQRTKPGIRGHKIQTELDYLAKTNKIRLTQTLFDWSRINAWQKGDAKAERSVAVFRNKVSDIALQLVDRYMQVLLAQENVALAQKNLEAAERQVEIARSLYDGGEGTITAVREAEAQRARAYARLQKAQSGLAVARRKLQAMTGRRVRRVHGLKPGFEPNPLQPSSLSVWITRAQENNAAIDVARKSVAVAAQTVDKTFGNFLPSANLIASYSHDQASSISLLGVESEIVSVGVQVNVPIFAGGEHWGRFQQTQYKYQRRRQKLAATREQVAVKVTRQYLNVISGAKRIAALEKAAHTAEQVLTAVRKSYQAGTRSISDILDAQKHLYKTRRKLVEARLGYIKSRIKLRMIAGSQSAEMILAAASQRFGLSPTQPR